MYVFNVIFVLTENSKLIQTSPYQYYITEEALYLSSYLLS